MILRFMGFAIVWQGVLFLTHWFFYITLIKVFDIKDTSIIIFLKYTLFGLSLSLDLAWFFVIRKYSKWGSYFYHGVFIWFGTLYFLIMASVVFWILKFINLQFNLNWNYPVIGYVLFSVALLSSIYGMWNSRKIRIKNYSITIPSLPEGWIGRKIVMFADSHLGNILGVSFMEKIVKIINEQNPDLVLIPGDYFDGPPVDFFKFTKPLSGILSKYGVYFASGNHEDLIGKHPYYEALSNAKVRVLNNEFIEIEGLQIIGVHFKNTQGSKNFKNVLNKILFNKEKPSILLKHVPSSLHIASHSNISLVLSGHTHKAQVFPFNFLTKVIFKGYDYGHKFFGQTQVLTTSGVGTWGPPQRVGTHSEILVIHLK